MSDQLTAKQADLWFEALRVLGLPDLADEEAVVFAERIEPHCLAIEDILRAFRLKVWLLRD